MWVPVRIYKYEWGERVSASEGVQVNIYKCMYMWMWLHVNVIVQYSMNAGMNTAQYRYNTVSVFKYSIYSNIMIVYAIIPVRTSTTVQYEYTAVWHLYLYSTVLYNTCDNTVQ